MSGPYDDILHLPHHASPTRARMTPGDRAAQFAPFAALTGYDALIQETGRWTDAPAELGEDARAELDGRLRQLCGCLESCPRVEITYFVPDNRKSGGAYVTAEGAVAAVSSQQQFLLLEDGREIPFGSIYSIQAPWFAE